MGLKQMAAVIIGAAEADSLWPVARPLAELFCDSPVPLLELAVLPDPATGDGTWKRIDIFLAGAE